MMRETERVAKVSQAVIVLNAQKPRTLAERARQAIESSGGRAELCVTRSPEEGKKTAERAIARGARWVIAAGGDGTVMSVLEPVVRNGCTLGVLPLGTANDFGTYLQLTTPERALDTLMKGETAHIDVTECTYMAPGGTKALGFFTSSAGAGVMGRLAELEDTRSATLLKRALGNGVWPLLATAATLGTRISRASIRCDGRQMDRSIAALELTKLPKIGGIELTPDASGDSGMLHVWIAQGHKRGDLLHTLRRALRGNGELLRSRHVQYVSRDPTTNALGVSRVEELELEAHPVLPVHLNGDFVGFTPAAFKLLPAALSVRVPKGHALAACMRTRRVQHSERLFT